MDLVDEEDAGDDFGAALLSPLGNLLVNLLTDLGLNFTDITGEEGHKALCSRVDNINLVECYGMNNLLALLKLTLRALDKTSLRSYVVIIAAAGK